MGQWLHSGRVACNNRSRSSDKVKRKYSPKMSKETKELAVALAKGFASDAAKAKARVKLAETDFNEGLWTGMQIALSAASTVCAQSAAVDTLLENNPELQELDTNENVVPL